MESRPSILVVVATWKRPGGLAALLEALRPQVEDHPRRRLVVVNDASHSAEYETVIGPHRGWLDYRAQPQRLGPGPTRQGGCEGASEDVIVFADDDCVPPPWWLDRAEALASAHPVVDFFGGHGRRAAPTRGGLWGIWQARSQVTLSPAVRNLRLHCAQTAITMVRRRAFEEAGGFASEFHGASEDNNLTYRLMGLGCLFVADPYWTTTHRSFSSVGDNLRRYYRNGLGNAQHLLKEGDREYVLIVKDYLRSWSRVLRDLLRDVFRPGVSATTTIEFAIQAIRATAYQRGLKAGLAKYARQYDAKLPPPASARDRVAAMVVEGAQSWERRFTRWRQRRAGQGTRARPLPAARPAAAGS